MGDVITRFAPSPTGDLHVGGARTALFCWALARRCGGRFLLRIEDTDQARSTEGATRGILESLAWLGLDWDEGPELDLSKQTVWGTGALTDVTLGGDPRGVGPFFQARRLDRYNEAIEELIERDLAYPAFESPEELEAKRKAAQARKETYRYDRAALAIPRAERLARMRGGEPHVVRFRMPDEAIVVRDEVLGEVRVEADQLDDFVLRKRDGYPTYHMACVVDDEGMGVTHVLRGQEHLINTPRHVALQRALGYRTPVYAHLPIICNPDGSKMSKRDKDKALKGHIRSLGAGADHLGAIAEAGGVSVEELEHWLGDKRAQLSPEALAKMAIDLGIVLPEINVRDFARSGYLPEVLCNYLALLGWNPGLKDEEGRDVERFGMDFLREHFSLERLGKKASRFDREKLLAFNGETLQRMPVDHFLSAWRRWLGVAIENRRFVHDFSLWRRLWEELKEDARGLALARAAQPRTKTLLDAIEHVRFALVDDDAVVFDEKAIRKVLHKGEPSGLEILRQVRDLIEGIDPFEPEAIEGAIRAWCEERGLKMGKAAQPLRVAITGTTVSPGLGETLALVGKKGVSARIDRCLLACDPGNNGGD